MKNDKPTSKAQVDNYKSKRPWFILLAAIVVAVIIIIIAKGISNNNKNSTNNNSQNSAAGLVSITDKGFLPATITVKAGQKILWVNHDTKRHQVASDPYPTDNALAGFKEVKASTPGGTYSFVFTKAGTYTYHDDLHPKVLGTVIVQ